MSDLPIALPEGGAENIPAALAAPKPRRAKPRPAFAVGEPVATEPAPEAPALPEPVASVTPAPSIPTAAAPADLPPEEPSMTDTIETMTDTATAKTEAMMGDMSGRAQDAMNKGAALFADWSSFGRGNVEALVESGKIAMSGLSTLAQGRAAYVRKQMEDMAAVARTMAAAKSPTELMKLQGDFVREQFDAVVAETSRSTEATLKLAGDVAQPLSNRMALAAEKVRQAA